MFDGVFGYDSDDNTSLGLCLNYIIALLGPYKK